MSTSKRMMIVLKSSDGESFEVEEEVAVQSQTIKHVIEDDCADVGIPLPNVTGKILAMVMEYCKRHADSSDNSGKNSAQEDLNSFDSEFVKVDQATLFHLMMAADYLDIKGLLDLISRAVVDIIRGKSPEEIRQILNIKNDFPPELEEQVRRENAWSYE